MEGGRPRLVDGVVSPEQAFRNALRYCLSDTPTDRPSVPPWVFKAAERRGINLGNPTEIQGYLIGTAIVKRLGIHNLGAYLIKFVRTIP